MPLINKEVLEFELEFDDKGAIKGIKDFNKEFIAGLRNVSKQTEALNKIHQTERIVLVLCFVQVFFSVFCSALSSSPVSVAIRL